MSKSAKSIFYFSIYLIFLGLLLLLIPNVVFSVFGVPATNEVWVRVVGMFLIVLSYYYFLAARNEQKLFFKATIKGRLAIVVSFIVFVAFDLAPPVLLVFALVDTIAALWTFTALKAE